MGQAHTELISIFRKKLIRRGFKECRSPMPTFLPDIFCRKFSKSGHIAEEVVVEAEIESTLFKEHTSNQLVLMGEYLKHQRKKRIRISGYLLVKKTKNMYFQANSLLDSLFPESTMIKVIQF